MEARATYFGLAAAASGETPTASMAAVAESAATTRYLDAPNAANATTGSNNV
jgi:hypothetical protein